VAAVAAPGQGAAAPAGVQVKGAQSAAAKAYARYCQAAAGKDVETLRQLTTGFAHQMLSGGMAQSYLQDLMVAPQIEIVGEKQVGEKVFLETDNHYQPGQAPMKAYVEMVQDGGAWKWSDVHLSTPPPEMTGGFIATLNFMAPDHRLKVLINGQNTGIRGGTAGGQGVTVQEGENDIVIEFNRKEGAAADSEATLDISAGGCTVFEWQTKEASGKAESRFPASEKECKASGK
jgi:hypothetical protein